MRFQAPFIAVLTALLSIAAADTLQKWTDIASKAKSNVIRLDHETFDQLVATDRNYTAISTNLPKSICVKLLTGDILVQLTALGAQYQCAMCRQFDPEFAVVAQSWRKAHPHSDGVFFANLDFAEGQQVFMRVCLHFRDFHTKCAVWDPVCSKRMGISAYHRSPVQVVVEQSAHYLRFPRTVNSLFRA